MTIMLRWARRIAIFLLLGAIANVAVAWGCVFAHTNTSWYDSEWYKCQARSPADALIVLITEKWGYSHVCPTDIPEERFRDSPHLFLRDYSGRMWWKVLPRDTQPEFWRHLASGWPMLTLAAHFECTVGDESDIHVRYGIVADAASLRDAFSPIYPTVLPYRPLWIGFLVNTALYGAVLAMLLYSPGRVRRSIRRRRGLCTVCAYPCGASPVCTECGEPLATSSARARSS